MKCIICGAPAVRKVSHRGMARNVCEFISCELEYLKYVDDIFAIPKATSVSLWRPKTKGNNDAH